jgi:GNAT superfamily N-acetyltransferase
MPFSSVSSYLGGGAGELACGLQFVDVRNAGEAGRGFLRRGEETRMKLVMATPDDVAELVVLRTRVSEDLAARFGAGYWAGRATEKGALFQMKFASVYLARSRGRVIASLALQKRKPWSIDVKHFHVAKKPAYLTSMAVEPAQQRKGLGRACVDEARRIAKKEGFDAIRLDAFDCAAGAGGFYLKCGFAEVARVVYKGVPLIDFEMPL